MHHPIDELCYTSCGVLAELLAETILLDNEEKSYNIS